MGNLHMDAEPFEIQLIEHWIKHPMSIQSLVDWPLLSEVFRPDLSQRIARIVAGDHERHAAPWKLQFKRGKTYFYPGSLEDLIAYVGAVVRCLPAIATAIDDAADRLDFSPPRAADIALGGSGTVRSWSHYWQSFSAQVCKQQVGHVVIAHADVRHCFKNIAPRILMRRLGELGAAPRAMQQLEQLLSFWADYDCPGLPFLHASRLLMKLYLSPVDAALRQAGVSALRIGDDFRIFCRSENEVQVSLGVLEQALANEELKLAAEKTWIESIGNPPNMLQRLHRNLARKLKPGIVRPLLGRMLINRQLRSFAIGVLHKLPARVQRATESVKTTG